MITVEAQTKLNKYFNLPAKGGEQDWDIELVNKNRIEEFVVALQETGA
jgi:hypothetical protein